MKKSEMRKLVKKENTIAKIRKELQQTTRYMEDYQVYVRCYTSRGMDLELITDLMVEVYDKEIGEWFSFYLASIEVKDSSEIEGWEFMEMTRDIFKTMKKNMVAELEKYGYENIDVEDYNC